MFDTYTCKCGKRFETRESREATINGARFSKRRKDCRACGVSFYTAEIPIDLAKEMLADD